MDLKLTEHARNTVSLRLLYEQKIPIFGTFSKTQKMNFGLYFAENLHFQVGHVLLR